MGKMANNQLPDPITFLEGLLPGNPFKGEPPLPRFLFEGAKDNPAEIREPFAVATAAAQDLGFTDFAEGGEGRKKRDEILAAILREGQGDGNPGHLLIDPKRPGCTAAETTILTRGILEDLADGMGGFGVLRQGKEYLEGGARAAARLGRQYLAQQLEEIANLLPEVHTPEEAGALAERLRPLEVEAWELGKRCKGIMSPEALARWNSMARNANEIGHKIMAGELSMADALRQVRRE